MTHEVFISYSHHDKLIADGVCANLESAGIRCWIAPRDIAPGHDWPTSISDAIDHSRVLVLIFSSRSNSSQDVGRELILAANNNCIIVPFKIEDVAPEPGKKYYLARTHWLDAMDPPTQEQVDKLVKCVHSLLVEAGVELAVKPPPQNHRSQEFSNLLLLQLPGSRSLLSSGQEADISHREEGTPHQYLPSLLKSNLQISRITREKTQNAPRAHLGSILRWYCPAHHSFSHFPGFLQSACPVCCFFTSNPYLHPHPYSFTHIYSYPYIHNNFNLDKYPDTYNDHRPDHRNGLWDDQIWVSAIRRRQGQVMYRLVIHLPGQQDNHGDRFKGRIYFYRVVPGEYQLITQAPGQLDETRWEDGRVPMKEAMTR